MKTPVARRSLAASAVLGVATLTVAVASCASAVQTCGTVFNKRQSNGTSCEHALSHRWQAVGLIGLVGVYLVLVPAVVALLRRARDPGAPSPTSTDWVGQWEDSPTVAVVTWMVVATVILGVFWLVVWIGLNPGWEHGALSVAAATDKPITMHLPVFNRISDLRGQVGFADRLTLA
jgi:hypothetical protein